MSNPEIMNKIYTETGRKQNNLQQEKSVGHLLRPIIMQKEDLGHKEIMFLKCAVYASLPIICKI